MIIIITITGCLLYMALLLWFLIGWKKTPLFTPEEINHTTKFSIIVPARNEENNILNTLEDLSKQDYPATLYEIIVVDDFSTDKTALITKDFIQNSSGRNIQIQLITPEHNSDNSFVAFKKKAIETGISHALGEWIVCTDADCQRGSKWLSTIASFIESRELCFVSAPVSFYNEKIGFEKMQSLEFCSLIGIGAASMANGYPNMCNGANLAFSKSAFYEVDGYSGINEIASGDDEFLMHKMAQRYPGKIAFLKNRDAVVFAHAQTSLAEFLSQRKRWASKSRKYTQKGIKPVIWFVYLFHLLLMVTFLFSFFNGLYLKIFLSAFLVKLISELIFVVPVFRWFKKIHFLPWYLPAAFFYIFYVVGIGFLGNSGGYEWKGRKVE